LSQEYSASAAMQGEYWDSAAERNDKANCLLLSNTSGAAVSNRIMFSVLSEKAYAQTSKKGISKPKSCNGSEKNPEKSIPYSSSVTG